MPKSSQHHALARQWQILRLLPSRAPGITSRELVDSLRGEFDVSKRTVERDLGELSQIFGIACNDKAMPYGWHWMRGVSVDLPGLDLSDALSLRLLEDLLRPLLPSALLASLEQKFAQARSKLGELAPGNACARWAEKVRYVPPSLPFIPPEVDPAVLDAVHEALQNEHQIELEYRNSSGLTQRYRLHPLGLVQHGARTYLLATAYEFEDVRLYALHRMQTVSLLVEQVRVPAGFSLDAYLSSGTMLFGAGDLIVLEAWVSTELGKVLSETPLNRSQTLLPTEDGYRLVAELHESWQLLWWVLSQGEKIRVLAPQAFKERVVAQVTAMAEGYGLL